MSNQDKTTDEKVEQILDAPTEPSMAEEHKELVDQTFKVLQDNGYSFWDAQQVTGLVIAAANTQDPAKALKTAQEISALYAEAGLDKVYVSAILQIMAEKINNQVNKMGLKEITIE
jgi:methyl coenzyme M reductase beta subunit